MSVKKGKYTKEDGPVKEFVSGLGIFIVFVGIVGGVIVNHDIVGFVIAAVGVVVTWLGSLIPSKNVVRW